MVQFLPRPADRCEIMSNQKDRSGYVGLAILLLIVLLAIAGWQIWGEPAIKRAAQHAIDAAVAACSQGGKQEFDHRMVEAGLAIDKLDYEDREMYQTALDNRLIAYGCKKLP
jgi:hypothetical protein